MSTEIPPLDARFRPGRYSSWFQRRDFALSHERYLDELTLEQRRQVETWMLATARLPWVQELSTPPFSVENTRFCSEVRELVKELLIGGRGDGFAYALDDSCYLQEPSNTWLAIKGATPFMSLEARYPLERKRDAAARLTATVESIQRATEWQCRRLEFAQSYRPLATAVVSKVLEEVGRLSLSYSLPGEQEQYSVVLAACSEDDLDIFSNCGRVFVASRNESVGYAGLEVFSRGKRLDNLFLMQKWVEALLGSDFWTASADERLVRLLSVVE